jgi:hypothetical protein
VCPEKARISQWRKNSRSGSNSDLQRQHVSFRRMQTLVHEGSKPAISIHSHIVRPRRPTEEKAARPVERPGSWSRTAEGRCAATSWPRANHYVNRPHRQCRSNATGRRRPVLTQGPATARRQGKNRPRYVAAFKETGAARASARRQMTSTARPCARRSRAARELMLPAAARP